jgi:two-component system chemotaxis response regulator CheY/two-component system phosphate regulon response regulator PhoB
MSSQKTAVIVEDNEPTRKLICITLESIGIKNIITAENGAKAIEALAHSKADIAIVDWQMDVMDGLEFTRQVRASHASINPNTPILMLTALTGGEAERQAYEAGVDLFVNKPFSVKLLFSSINKLLKIDAKPLR